MRGQKDALIIDMSSEDIQKYITDNLTIKKEEKDKLGEVFTPPVLIKEMLDKFPPTVWTNPDLKWLDPANGIGNFPMMVYEQLMVGLIKWESNKTKRSNHILKNMLYMVEINPTNVKISRKIFGKDANIACGDFLKMDLLEKFGVDKFDVIVGNPPFNDEKKDTNKTTIQLWDKFLIYIFKILKINGFLGLIHPQNWRGPNNPLWKLLTTKQIIYLHIYGEKATKNLFQISSKVDLYVLQNKEIYENTNIIDELGNKLSIQLNKLYFLPNYKILELQKILINNSSIDIIKDNIHSSSKTQTNKTDKFKYPIISSITDGNELHFRYSDNNEEPFGIKKVIINGGRYAYSYNDYLGNYGITQNLFAIKISNKHEGDIIIKALNTDKFKEIMKATKWGAFPITDYRMFKYFKPDFYKEFISDEKDKAGTKIQSIVRGKQTRKKLNKKSGGSIKNKNGII